MHRAMLFQPWQQRELEKLGQEILGREKTGICVFFKAAAPAGTAAVAGKAATAPRWPSCAWGEECGVRVSCRAHPPHCHPLPSHLCCLALPVPWRAAELVAEALLCCWLPSTHRGFLCRSVPLLRAHPLWGREKRNLHFFQGRKIRVNFFSFMWHNPTK